MQFAAKFKLTLVLVILLGLLLRAPEAQAGRFLDRCKSLLAFKKQESISLFHSDPEIGIRYEKVEQELQRKIKKALESRHGKLMGPPVKDIQEYFDLLITSKQMWGTSRTSIKQVLDIIYDVSVKSGRQTPRITNLVRGLIRAYDVEFTPLLRVDLVSGYLYLASVGEAGLSLMQTVFNVFLDPGIVPEHREYGETIFNFVKQYHLINLTEVRKNFEEAVRHKSFTGHFDYQIRNYLAENKSKDIPEKRWNDFFNIREAPPVTQDDPSRRTTTPSTPSAQDLANQERIRLASEESKRELKTRLRGKMQTPGELGEILGDIVVYRGLNALSTNDPFKNAVVLLFGNAVDQPSPAEEGDYEKIASGLAKENKTIIFDADSKAAPAIIRGGGVNAIGISAHHSSTSPIVFRITNPYMRLAIFTKLGDRRFVTPNSIVGRGVSLKKEINGVFDPTGEWRNRINEWSADVETRKFDSLRVSFPFSTNPAIITKPSQVVEKAKGYSFVYDSDWNASHPPRTFDSKITLAEHFLATFSDWQLRSLEGQAEQYLKRRGALRVDKNNQPIPGGAVVFGSSNIEKEFTQLVYQSSRNLALAGIPVVTGGAGGFMAAANAGAYDAGGSSIGIPMSGIGEVQQDETHTLTVPAEGYEERIPFLLDRRQIVVIAPGRDGTLRELAVTLLDFGSNSQDHRQLVFLGGAYYNRLAHWLGEPVIPPEFKQRIWVIDNPSQFADVQQRLEAYSDFVPSSLRENSIPQPRNQNTRFLSPEEVRQMQRHAEYVRDHSLKFAGKTDAELEKEGVIFFALGDVKFKTPAFDQKENWGNEPVVPYYSLVYLGPDTPSEPKAKTGYQRETDTFILRELKTGNYRLTLSVKTERTKRLLKAEDHYFSVREQILPQVPEPITMSPDDPPGGQPAKSSKWSFFFRKKGK